MPSAPPHLVPPPVTTTRRVEDGASWPLLVWRLDPAWSVVSSAPVGGGWGPRSWILNAQVPPGYARRDLAGHIDELATPLGLARGRGVGLLTAADVTAGHDAADGGVVVRATVGVRLPTWAAAPDETSADEAPPIVGTINLVVLVPTALTSAALVNLATTVTEAKAQALLERQVAGTGTASDAVLVACPAATADADAAPFGGPRSPWGARAARATHAAVTAGIHHSHQVMRRETGTDRG